MLRSGVRRRYSRPVSSACWTLEASDGELLSHRAELVAVHGVMGGQPTGGGAAHGPCGFARGAAQSRWGEVPAGTGKTVARSHALKSLQAGRFPQIRFHADDLQRSGDGSRVTGSLEIHGRTARTSSICTPRMSATAGACPATRSFSNPTSGSSSIPCCWAAMKVVDEATVSVTARRPSAPDPDCRHGRSR